MCFADIEFSKKMLNEITADSDEPKTLTYAALLQSSFRLHPNFITPEEEENLMKEVEPHLKRQVYEKDHWDDVRF